MKHVYYALLAVLLNFGPALAGQPDRNFGEITFKVTYADGKAAELKNVPASNEGIRSVARVIRLETQIDASVIGAYCLKFTDRPEPLEQELSWDGKAWVIPVEEKGESDRQRIRGAIEMELALANAAALTLQRKAVEEAAPGGQAGAQGPRPADQKKLIDEAFDRLSRRAEAIKAAMKDDAMLDAAGEVAQAKPSGAEAMGIVKPIERFGMAIHKSQVWLVPTPGHAAAIQGRKWTYQVEIAHPEAGAAGAFYHVAYADTDGDGAPDRLIARSPLAQAEIAGGWTCWSFSSDEHVVFVGSAWAEETTSVYFDEVDGGKLPDIWKGLAGEAYVSEFFGCPPFDKWRGRPLVANIRVLVK